MTPSGRCSPWWPGSVVDTLVGTAPPAGARAAADVVQEHLLACQGSRRRPRERVPGRISIVMPTSDEFRMTIAAVSATLRTTSTDDIEIVIVDNGSKAEVGARLVAAFLTEPRVRYHRVARNVNFALGCNIGLRRSRAASSWCSSTTTPSRAATGSARCLPGLDDPSVRGVQPLLLYPDDSIQSAGLYFPAKDTLPCHFLVGHPPEDAHRAGERRFYAASGAALLLRAAEFEALGGFDVEFVNGMEDVDLCLRADGALRWCLRGGARGAGDPSRGQDARARRGRPRRTARPSCGGGARACPSPDTDRLSDIGFRLAHIGADDVAIPVPRPVLTREVGGQPRRLAAAAALGDQAALDPRPLRRPLGRHASGPLARGGAARARPGRGHLPPRDPPVQRLLPRRRGARHPRARADPPPGRQDQRAVGDQPPRRRHRRRAASPSTWCSRPPRPGAVR